MSRNWKWAVPLLVCAYIVLMVVTIGGFLWGISRGIKSSGAYKLALQRAQADKRVAEVIGSPVKEGWYVTGQIHVNGPGGKAELAFPIAGSTGKAEVFVQAHKTMGEWHLDDLVVEFENPRKRIDLLSE